MDKKIHITIGRNVGAGGLEVAQKLSQRLGIELFDRELIALAAQESGLDSSILENRDEQPVSSNRFLRFLGSKHSTYNEMNSYISNNILSEDKLFAIQSDVIRKVAEEKSSIFVGRCADYILRDMPNLMTVFISADMEYRIVRNAEKNNITPDEVENYIEKAERKRKAYYDYYTFKQWGDSSSYDLCVSTSCFGIDGCVEIIIEALKKKGLI